MSFLAAPWRDEWEAFWHCDHTQWAWRGKDTSAGAALIYKQCTACGESKRVSLKDAPSSIRATRETLERVDDELAQAHHREKWADWDRRRAETDSKANDQWWAEYTAYLLTPEWRARRVKVFRRAGGICEGCGEAQATQVHHLTYERLGREMLFDLRAICDRCHAVIHEERERQPMGNGLDERTDETDTGP